MAEVLAFQSHDPGTMTESLSLSLIHATLQTPLSEIAMFVRVMRPLPEVVAVPGYRSSYVATRTHRTPLSGVSLERIAAVAIAPRLAAALSKHQGLCKRASVRPVLNAVPGHGRQGWP
jgi:hypothetical protein